MAEIEILPNMISKATMALSGVFLAKLTSGRPKTGSNYNSFGLDVMVKWIPFSRTLLGFKIRKKIILNNES